MQHLLFIQDTFRRKFETPKDKKNTTKAIFLGKNQAFKNWYPRWEDRFFFNDDDS